MRFFVIPDIHGHPALLEGLLTAAGVLDEEGNRVPDITTISVGDLANAVYESQGGDSECLLKVHDWIDTLLVGNHEMGYIFGANMSFGGYYEHPDVSGLYRSLYREGIVQPCYCVPEWNLLITHAGVAPEYGLRSAVEANDLIRVAWSEPPSRWEKLGVTEAGVPVRYLLAGVGRIRGGMDPIASIFWRDWNYEGLEKRFSQIVGHTPIRTHDLLQRTDGTFSLNIDTGGKHGRGVTGVMLSGEEKPELEFIRFDDPDE